MRNNKPKYFIALCFLIAFLGYAIGRIGHILRGYKNGLHHWIPALVVIILSIFFYKFLWGKLLFSFGIGFFISDLNDFLHFKIISPDDVNKYVFFGVD